MKFIEHSNSVYKSNKKYVSPKVKKVRKIILESVVFIVVLVILFGILHESIQSNNASNALRSAHKLGGYGENKITYGVSGSGSTITLFESDIGETLLEWNPIIRESISGTRMIYYDRFGYGGSDVLKGKIKVETQSDILDNLVNNAGYKGIYLLVSEGYGSLIHLDYLEKYKDKVSGMILINPYVFMGNSNESFFDKLLFKIKLWWMKLISTLGIPRLLNKFSLLNNPYIDLYNEKAISRNKENYINKMVSKNYYDTILKEKESMDKYLKNFNLDNLGVYDIPVVIIESEKNRNESIEKKLREHFTNLEIIYFENTDNFSYTHSEYLINLISNVNSRIEERK